MDARQEIEDCLVQRYAELFKLACWFTHNADTAHDLVQDTACRALGAVATYETRTLEGYENLMWPWLKTILQNLYYNSFRNRNCIEYYHDITAIADERADYRQLPDQEEAVYWLEVLAALKRLPPEISEAIGLIKIDGFSYQDAAKIMHVPVGTAKSRCSRGRDAMRVWELIDA
jgi:RNA polymerase sigma-70 factor (ECF subfamily)